jgi:hypothetical protein
MAKGIKKKKPKKVERKDEEEEEENDLNFDKLSKKDMIKNKSYYLNNKKSISLARLKSLRL